MREWRRGQTADCSRLGRRRSNGWEAAHEALRVAIVGGVKHLLTLLQDARCATVVQLRGREAFDAAMPMLVVIPGEEGLAVASRFLEASEETVRKSGCVGPLLGPVQLGDVPCPHLIRARR